MLALQRGVHLHNTARKLPQVRDGGGPGGGGGGSGAVRNDWRTATVAYLRAAAASLVSLGSTSSPKDCANLCRLFSKAGELLVEEAADDIRALEMFEDADVFFRRLPGSFYGAGGQSSEMPSLSTDDLIMAVHKASSRRIEVLSRTTGDVDQMLESYEQQLKLLATRPPAGLSVSTAVHAASVGEERFKKGDCRGASRILRLALQALGGGDLRRIAELADSTPADRTAGLRRTILFSLAYCYSKSGDHNQAIKCIAQLEGVEVQAAARKADFPNILFAKCKVLSDAGDLNGAYESAKALVAAMPAAPSAAFGKIRGDYGRGDGTRDSHLDLATARMVSSSEDCSDRSLELFASIASRSAGTPKALDARVALLRGIAMAARLRDEGCGAAAAEGGVLLVGGAAAAATTAAGADKAAAERAETIADDIVSVIFKCKSVATCQVEGALEVLVTFAEFFQGREEWQACSRWCTRAITLAKHVVADRGPVAADSRASTPGREVPRGPPGGGGEGEAERDGAAATAAAAAAAADSLLLASLLTLRGEMECRVGDFSSSSQTLDQALAQCPTYGRAREVAFWSAARDPSRDESSLSARLSALSGPRSGLPPEDRRSYLAKCVSLVVGAKAAAVEISGVADHNASIAEGSTSGYDSRVTMVQERLLDALLLSAPATPAATAAAEGLDSTAPAEGRAPLLSSPCQTSAPHAKQHHQGPTVGPAAAVVARGEEYRGQSALVPMEVEGEGSGASDGLSVAGCAGGSAAAAAATLSATAEADEARGGGSVEVPTAIQVVASMVDAALQRTSELDASTPPRGPTTGDATASVLSRVLLSVDKTLRCAGSLGIGPLHDPDIQYLSQGCWNLALRCCGSACDLPWAEGAGSPTAASNNDHSNRMLTDDNDGHASPKSKQNQLLGSAPAFFKASRNWTEIRSDANAADALLTRQNCMVLSIASMLELHDSDPAGGERDANDTASSTRRDMLERARKEVEAANGLNRQLSGVEPEKAAEMRSILLVAEMSVLGRLGDFVAARSLVIGREPDFLRCSSNLLRYCVQLAEDMLGDDRLVAGLCRLCIRCSLEEDPVDTRVLGDLYRRLLVSASSREEALRVVDDFAAKVKDLQEGPGMPSEDVDYFSAKCYNLGLQLMEMGRPSEAERLVGKALGLVKLGSTKAFASRWEATIFQVYRTTLEAKGVSGVIDHSSKTPNGPPGQDNSGSMSGGLQVSVFGRRRAFLSTGLFPMPP